ncbi:signal recognition particle protein [Candidatus Pelagisphaera phototrophica]|uniref:signal recognition particle protein n=1 Tax=Candidatus Pelagisphaera phototrophica TaxID=2684113 RepID=UPI001A062DE0|nr:signal recognition particle protein [Candidatus Pelagisphaera phototrophica]QXD31957.1 signal recognition particle protein [Candidatus Pelagisphaera phototrophica]
MFESLTDKLSHAMRQLRGTAKLSEENMSEALKEVRAALLSADVHFKVAREFIETVKEKCVGQEVLKSVTPSQQIIKIINDELVRLLGEGETELSTNRPLKILMVGLQGGGKTTTSAKIAKFLKKEGYNPLLVACDIYRPAAIDQLESVGEQIGVPVFSDRSSPDVPLIGENALKQSQIEGRDLIIFDTAGRLQIDAPLIEEIKELKRRIQPDEVILVADGAIGQEAINVAESFHEAVELTGIAMTKLDGDARGGAALSMKQITNVPIKFAGTGEKLEDFDLFHADRMASRILGMGDVVSLVEKAQESIDEKEAERMAGRMMAADFNFEDMLNQFSQVKKLGSMQSIMGMMPGMSGMKMDDKAENQMKQSEAIILSMTLQERRSPNVLNASRRNRIAKGSGVKISQVNQLIKQHMQMKKMMKKLNGGGKMKKMMKQMKAQGMDPSQMAGGDLGSGLGGFKGKLPF